MTDLSLIPQNRVENLSTQLGATVNTSGNQTIAGNKTFSGTTTFNNGILSTASNSGIMITNPNYTQGTAPSSTQWGRIDFRDKNNVEMAQCLTGVDNTNRSFAALWVHSPKASDTSSKWMLTAQCDTNGNYSLVSGVTPATSDNSTKIATTAYVRNCITDILGTLYPVGSTYITTASTCPLSTLISGSTWTKVSEGRVLQGSDSNHSAGSTIEAGLPNITGNVGQGYNGTALNGGWHNYQNGGFGQGALYLDGTNNGSSCSWSNYSDAGKIAFDASRSNPIYGNSTTVQPPAYVVNIFKRTA